MGIFDLFKKKTDTGKKANDHLSEFDRDVKALLARDDIQCMDDVCEAEYAKAIKLLESPTQESVRRAYDLMGNLASQFQYIPAVMWMGDFAENAMKKPDKAVYWYKIAAEAGDGNGARCYADMLMAGAGVERNPQLAMQYYAKAANAGVPEAQFVMGEYFRNAGDLENARKAYASALKGGYQPAKIRLDQMG